MNAPVPVAPPKRLIELTIDGTAVRVPEGTTILQACRAEGIDTPVYLVRVGYPSYVRKGRR